MPDRESRRAPLLAVLALAPTILLTVIARLHPAVFSSLRRDPDALLHGELWRLVSPVLVQADALERGGWPQTIAVFALVAAVLMLGERAFGAKRALLLYALGAVIGHAVGELWQPYSSGCSVAACGVLGGLAAWLLRAKPRGVKVGSLSMLVLGVVATLLGDIHGPPLLAGAVVGGWGLRAAPLPRRWT